MPKLLKENQTDELQKRERSITVNRVATNLENLENAGNLKNCQSLRENSGKSELFEKKPGKLRENGKTCDVITNKDALHRIFLC